MSWTIQETVLDFFAIFSHFLIRAHTHSLDWEMEHEVVDIAVVIRYRSDGQLLTLVVVLQGNPAPLGILVTNFCLLSQKLLYFIGVLCAK